MHKNKKSPLNTNRDKIGSSCKPRKFSGLPVVDFISINLDNELIKGIFLYETRQKIFRFLGGKIEFEFWPLRQGWAVGPIQI